MVSESEVEFGPIDLSLPVVEWASMIKFQCSDIRKTKPMQQASIEADHRFKLNTV